MRAHKVYEFKRGRGIKQALGVGFHARLGEVLDKIRTELHDPRFGHITISDVTNGNGKYIYEDNLDKFTQEELEVIKELTRKVGDLYRGGSYLKNNMKEVNDLVETISKHKLTLYDDDWPWYDPEETGPDSSFSITFYG